MSKPEHIFIAIAFDDTSEGPALREIGALRTDEDGTPKGACHDKVRGDGSVPLVVAIETIGRSIIEKRPPKFVVVAHMADAVSRIVGKSLDAAGIANPFDGHAWIDTHQIAWPLAMAGCVESRSLEVLARYFSADLPARRTMAEEATAIGDVYWRMMGRFMTAAKIEKGVRSKIGSIVESFGGFGGVRRPEPEAAR